MQLTCIHSRCLGALLVSIACVRLVIAAPMPEKSTEPNSALCNVQYAQIIDSSVCAPTAIKLLSEKHFKSAVVAFYQFYRCPNVLSFNGLNSLTSDLGLIGPFDQAMEMGARGQYEAGITELRTLTARADEFVEAKLMLGVFLCAEGRRSEAVQTWKLALRSRYFPVPFPEPFPVQLGLKEAMTACPN